MALRSVVDKAMYSTLVVKRAIIVKNKNSKYKGTTASEPNDITSA
jgi:hypothetical protein